ncbi:rhomboid family intramembrane serine protease [Ectothiorhodospiraceae bacterium WFHF3C12]|nr:rhomboid family intramembrane serine protease [Ectothiorhodospiraceae bacterium WFHF3C12]
MDPAQDRTPSALPPVVLAMLVLNGLVFLLEQTGALYFLIEHFALWPITGETDPFARLSAAPFRPWQVLTYGFLHAPTNILHLFVNMFALWMFGVQLENLWGSRPFLFYYLFCLVGAGLIQLGVASYAAAEGGAYPTLGASGAVFGILLGFGMMFPNQRILLLFPPIPMKAKWFVILYGAFELWAGFSGSMSGVAHFAHIGGMVFGFIMIQYWRGRLPVKPRRRLMM